MFEAPRPADVTLRLGWPPRETAPNARAHYMKKAQRAGIYRHECKLVARSELVAMKAQGLTFPLKEPVAMRITFVMRRYDKDPDNLLASFKAGLDGMVDAGLFTDD